jgi:hypothetical protein
LISFPLLTCLPQNETGEMEISPVLISGLWGIKQSN